MKKTLKIFKRLLPGIVLILVLYAVFFKEIAMFVGCVASCLFVGFYDFRETHDKIMKGDFAKGEVTVWKVGEETEATNVREIESAIDKWKCSEHAPCYKLADIFVPVFVVQIGDLLIHVNQDMLFYVYRDLDGAHNYARLLDESDIRLKKCLERGWICRPIAHQEAIHGGGTATVEMHGTQ